MMERTKPLIFGNSGKTGGNKSTTPFQQDQVYSYKRVTNTPVTPIKGASSVQTAGLPWTSLQSSSSKKGKTPNSHGKYVKASKIHQPKAITFIEGAESLRLFPPPLMLMLKAWCMKHKTANPPFAKRYWGAKDSTISLFGREGRSTMFVSAETLREVPVARYKYGSKNQLLVIRDAGEFSLIQSIPGHTSEVELEDGTLWTASPWTVYEDIQKGQKLDATKAQFYRLTQKPAHENKEHVESCDTSKVLSTAITPQMPGKQSRKPSNSISDTRDSSDSSDSSDEEPLAKRRNISLSSSFPSIPRGYSVQSPATPTPLGVAKNSPIVPSPCVFLFKRNISDNTPIRKPVGMVKSVDILFKHAEVAGIITKENTMLQVFPKSGVRCSIIRDDYEEFENLHKIISRESENGAALVPVLPEE